jgi:Xaa-Pro aminopeptidase
MQTSFGPDFFSSNRTTLRQAVGPSVPIIVTGNGVMQRGGDEPSRFHQDSNFWYLTGLDGADLTLVMSGTETYVIVPGMSATREAFDGAHDIAAYAARSGIESFLPERAGWQRVHAELQAARQIATLGTPPPFVRSHGLHTLPYRRRLIARLKRLNSHVTIRDIRPELAALRVIKQPEELRALQRAIDITSETLQAIATGGALGSARHEYELEAALTYGFRTRGATDHAFAPIVGAGQHGTTLHYLANDGPIAPDDLIVLDVGAETEHYAADITRTVSQAPIAGRKADVFHAVAAVQDYALSLIKPGTSYRDYEQAVEAFMGQQLVLLGLIKQASRENIRRYYPHATSHFLGLDTHDVGDYRQPWQAGMVITCEPGIYIPEEGIGIRIEDDILITKTGHTSLSSACPRELTPVQ